MTYQELKLKMLQTPLSAGVFNFNYKKLKKGERSELMHLALRHENFDLFERIISAGVKIDTKSEDGLSILHNLILNVESEVCSSRMFDFLKEQEGVKLDQKIRHKEGSVYSEMSKKTPIELALIKRRHHLLRGLIESGGVARYKQKEEKGAWQRAIAMDNVEAFKVLAQITSPLTVVLDDKKTLLIEAYQKQALGCLAELFSNPANLALINKADKSKHTALMYAVLNKDMDHVSFFVQNNADLNCKTPKGNTALMYAVQTENIECIRFLLQRGADINARDDFGYTALVMATRRGRVDIIDCLMNAGASAYLAGKDCRNALIFAVEANNSECVRRLLKTKVLSLDNQVSPKGVTALIVAAENDNYDILSQLLDAGANVHIMGGSHLSVLKTAIYKGSEKSILKLLSVGAKLRGRGSFEAEHSGELSKAILGKNPEKCLQLMLETRKNPNNIIDQDRHRLDLEDALVAAFESKNKNCLSLLIKNKVSPLTVRVLLAAIGQIDFWTEDFLVSLVDLAKESKDFTSKNNRVVLKCVISNHVKLLTALVNAGASIEMVDKVGDVEVESNDRSLLLYACARGNVEVVRFLLSQNVLDVNVQNADGVSPLFYAANIGSEECVHLLFQHGAKVKVSKDSLSPLVIAARNGYLEVVRALLKEGADVADKAGTHEGWDITALTIAGFRGHEEIVELLYKQGRIEEQLDFSIEEVEGEDGPEIEVSLFVQEFPHYFEFLNKMYSKQSVYIPDKAIELTQRVLRVIAKFLFDSKDMFINDIKHELLHVRGVNPDMLLDFLLEGFEEAAEKQFVEMLAAKMKEVPATVSLDEKVAIIQYITIIVELAHNKEVIDLEEYAQDYDIDADGICYNVSEDAFIKLYDRSFLKHLFASMTLLDIYRPSAALNGFVRDSFLSSQYIVDTLLSRSVSIVRCFKERNMDTIRVIYTSLRVSAYRHLLPHLPAEIRDIIVSFLLPFLKGGSVYECDFQENPAVTRVKVQDSGVQYAVRNLDGLVTLHSMVDHVTSISEFKKR